MAVAELFRTDRGDHLGIAGRLRDTEGFEVLCNCILVRAGKGGNGAQEAKRKHRKGELTAIDLHGVSSRFDRVFVTLAAARTASAPIPLQVPTSGRKSSMVLLRTSLICRTE